MAAATASGVGCATRQLPPAITIEMNTGQKVDRMRFGRRGPETDSPGSTMDDLRCSLFTDSATGIDGDRFKSWILFSEHYRYSSRAA